MKKAPGSQWIAGCMEPIVIPKVMKRTITWSPTFWQKDGVEYRKNCGLINFIFGQIEIELSPVMKVKNGALPWREYPDTTST
jgi:hypothetical protein